MHLKRRLFFALWPDDSIRKQFIQLACAIHTDNHQLGKKVVETQLHLTLVFLGAIPAQELSCIQQAGAKCQMPAFTLTLDQVQLKRRAQMIWLIPSQPPDPLTQLVQALHTALIPCGYTPSERQFLPHVTLIQKTKQLQPLSFSPIHWPVKALYLFESNTKQTGAEYTLLHRWQLS